ncbi:MAG: Bro-N domain-containing protein [Pseudodesulfovibrio sp.]|uniref:BRO-N domain-containing protein n=1 Tax=Pseudodesulfovibrio sp. TaxID=2035812 RepID=UPI003D101F09
MYEVIISQFEGADVRVVDVDGAPWFATLDVMKMLGLKCSPSSRNYMFGEDERMYIKQSALKAKAYGISLSIPNRGLNFISESGFYKLVMQSSKPDAKPFQDWVTKSVLPAIRKDGGYIAGEEKVATGEMSEDEFIFKAMTMMQGKIERLSKERDEALSVVAAMHWSQTH